MYRFFRQMNSKFMNRISMVFFTVIIGVFFPTILFMVSKITDIVVDNQMDKSRYVVNELDNSLQDTFDSLHQLIRQMYGSKSVVDFLEISKKEVSLETYSESYNLFSIDIKSLFYAHGFLKTIEIYKKADTSYYYFSQIRENTFQNGITWEDNIQRLSENGTQVFQLEPTRYDSLLAMNCFKVNSNLKTLDRYENTAVVSFTVEVSEFARLISSYYSGELPGIMYIFSKEGDIIFDSSSAYDSKFVDSILQKQQEVIYVDNQKYYVNYSAENELDCIVCHVIPERFRDNQFNSIIRLVILSFLIAATLIVFITIFVNHLFSEKINEIIYYIKEIERGELQTRIPKQNSSDEFQLISNSINHMCEKLQEYIQKVYVAQLEKKDAELRLKNTEVKTLQAQINPHFLYNTLEIIRMKLNAEKENESADMILILSKLFRNSIKGNLIITLGEEIQSVKLFLKLYKLKYKFLQTEFEIDEDVLGYAAIRSTFQPILENCVTHGYLGEDEFIIHVKCQLKNNAVKIIISDNGRGIEAEKLDYINECLMKDYMEETKHIGLFNVSNRLHLIFGNAATMYIKSEMGKGTSVHITYEAKRRGDFEDYV